MADQLISDAVPYPQDEGLPNLTDGEDETYNSAASEATASQAIRSPSYVASDSELAFENHDGTNDTVDLTPGIAYLDLSGETVDIQSGLGSDNSTPGYDTTLPSGGMIMVVVPTTVTGVALQDSTLSDVWLAYDTDGTGPGDAGSVYLRSDDTGSVTAPSHPSVQLGGVNPDDPGADSLANRHGSPSFESSTTAENPVVDVTHPEFGAVGDGSTVDDDAVNDAQTAAPAGSTLWFPAGEYLVNSLTVDTEGLTLDGPGTLVGNQDDQRLVDVQSNNSTVSVDIDCDTASNTGVYINDFDGTTVRDCTIENTFEEALIVVDADGATATDTLVENCRLLESGRAAVVAFDGTHGLTVRDCYVEGWMRRRDLLDGALDAYSTNSRNLRFEDNTVDTTSSGASSGGGHVAIRFQGAEDCTAEGNTVIMQSPDNESAVVVGPRGGTPQSDTTLRNNTYHINSPLTQNSLITANGDVGTVEIKGEKIYASEIINPFFRGSGTLNAGEVTIEDLTINGSSGVVRFFAGNIGTVEDVTVRDVDYEFDTLQRVIRAETDGIINRVKLQGCSLVNPTTGSAMIDSQDGFGYLTVTGNYLQGDPAVSAGNANVEEVIANNHQVDN